MAISQALDSTNPDLTAFYKRGGKLIVTMGTNDTTASTGAQLDYYQSVLDKMGRSTVDAFARFRVMPQAGHSQNGAYADIDGDGKPVTPAQLPSQFDRFAILRDWVENNKAPAQVTTTGGDRSLPLCTYPSYPKYVGGSPAAASSYTCAAR
jgi:feruloyl esterase